MKKIFEYLRIFINKPKDEKQPNSGKCFVAITNDNWFLHDNYKPMDKKIDENSN